MLPKGQQTAMSLPQGGLLEYLRRQNPKQSKVANLTEASYIFIKRFNDLEHWDLRHIGSGYASGPHPVCEKFDGFTNKGDYVNVWLFLAQQYLLSYEKLFPQEAGKGVGLTIHLALLKQAASDEATVCVMTLDRMIRFIEARAMLDYATERRTIRRPQGEASEEASCPAKMWKRAE